jgi:hypothetical protein
MTPAETAATLRQFNEWRRGDEDIPQPDPREIGEAINAAIEMIERLESSEKERANANAAAVNIALEAERLQCENDALRAKIAAIEKQEPVAWARKLGLDVPSFGCVTDLKYRPSNIPESSYIPLYTLPGAQPAPSFADAYQGAMEEAAIWKKRALEAEDLNRKFIAEINGPTHMGEPAPSVLEDWPTEEMTTAFARVFNVRDQSGTFTPAFRAALAAAPKPEGE